jgi:hypothetical protein
MFTFALNIGSYCFQDNRIKRESSENLELFPQL